MDEAESVILARIAATDFETPFVTVDAAVEAANIARAAAKARAAGVALRPHAKTHKSIEVARAQIAAGAVGLTVAKVAEAEVFLGAGFTRPLIAYPLIDPRKIARTLRRAAEAGTEVILMCDGVEGVDAIGREAARLGVFVEVRVKVDVGQHRCGVAPDGNLGPDLARRIADDPHLRFGGLMSHAGHAYAAADADAVRAIARTERELILDLARRIREAGLPVPAVSVGSTPTVLLADDFDGIDEIRPGNYVFNDLTQVSLGAVARSDVALSVVATVVSRAGDRAVIDAGSKALSSDRGPHGSTRLSGYGTAIRVDAPDAPEMPVIGLSEEHAIIAVGDHPPAIGERVRVLPNHACPVVNLTRELIVLHPDGAATRRAIAASGAVL